MFNDSASGFGHSSNVNFFYLLNLEQSALTIMKKLHCALTFVHEKPDILANRN